MGRFFLVPLCCSLVALLATGTAAAEESLITSLGRIEPAGGIFELSGPSGTAVVITELNVQVGDQVSEGQVLAVLDTYSKRKANLQRLQAILDNASKQLKRQENLSRSSVTSQTQLDEARLEVKVAQADIAIALAELAEAQIKSPIAGQVLEIHSYPGERIGDEGLLELGRTQSMYVVAEVYETDISRVKVGQRATIKSDALPGEVTGTVERIGLKIGKTDIFDNDPVAKADARVIETYIALDESEAAARYTNLQVEVSIEP